jgi:hypothetical protein
LKQLRLTVELNPFSGVSVSDATPLCPLFTVKAVGEMTIAKSGGNGIIVSTRDAEVEPSIVVFPVKLAVM